ncbi:AMP-binding protein [Rhodococcus sp. NPDC057529]|uniref:AMP-binding protein n=1 Tax=Rhodococcus sp. NPDC057529 TaxID=3346158 RepID=UPI0036728A5C
MSWYDDRPWLAHYDDIAKTTSSSASRTTTAMLAEAVASSPDGPAVSYLGATLTYRDVDELSDGVADYLREQGFRPGDRLGLYLQNVPQFVLALFGAWKAGGVVVPLNPMYRDELVHIFADAEVTALVCGESEWADHVASRAGEAGIRIVLTASELDLQVSNDRRLFAGRERIRSRGVEDLLEVARSRAGRTAPDPELRPDSIALVSYTSGTSGRSKGATNTHGNLCANSSNLRLLSRVPSGSPVFALAPLFHITGMVGQLLNAVDLVSPLVLAYRFEPGVVLDVLRRARPAFMVGPSTAYMALMSHPDFSRDAFGSFRTVASGGAPLPHAVVERFRDATGLYLRNGYGLTESSAGTAAVPAGREAPVDLDSGTLSVGVPLPAALVRIVDENRRDLGPGEVGEITVEGPMVVPAYWNLPKATSQSIPNGRLYTGDVGFMDRDGWLYVVDRKKDMINASGFKVWPREVEDVLYQHPAVREAAVVGIPDDYRGETVAAFVSLRPGHAVEPQEVVEFCRERLAAYKAPRSVEVLDELPKTASGKILRREMR